MKLEKRDKEVEERFQEIKQDLKKKKGYFNKGRIYKGRNWLANHYGCSPNMIDAIITELRLEIKISQLNYQSKGGTLDHIHIKEPGTYVVVGCAHVPWHNKNMFKSIFNFIKETPIKGIVLAGDILDLNSLSQYDRGNVPLEGVTLAYEYSETNKFLDALEKVLPDKATKVFLYGNHEDRHNRLKRNIDYFKYGKALISPEEGLRLHKRGYKVLTDWKQHHVSMGKDLDIIHGEVISIHAAKRTIDTYKKSTLFFHTHRTQSYVDGDVAGYNAGSTADFNAPIFSYASRAMKKSWSNSFALVTIDVSGNTFVEIIGYKNYKICVGGKLY